TMKATSQFGSIQARASDALKAGCDMVIVCNDRPAAARAVAALRDYSNPPSLVRLARLHGSHAGDLATLQASDDWQRATALVSEATARPVLELDA
ncbi:MAG: beta-N-acetylhexosaminidase, partial [Pseudomonadota bacterium]